MHAVSGQGIQEYREGSYQCLTFTGCHFRNLTFVQNDTTEQLYIVVYHVPDRIVTTGYPVVLVDGLIAFNAYEIFGSGQMAVELRSGYRDFFIFGKRLAVSFTMEKATGSTSSNAFS